MIAELTAQQAAQLRQYRDECLAYGTSTEPADRATTEAVLCDFYHRLGKARPAIVWCAGPASGSLLQTLLSQPLDHALDHQIRTALDRSLQRNLVSALDRSLQRNLVSALDRSLQNALDRPLRKSLVITLQSSLGTALDTFIDRPLLEGFVTTLQSSLGKVLVSMLQRSLGDGLGTGPHRWSFWGQHEYYWSALYDFPDRYLRPLYTAEQRTLLAQWVRLARSCGWWQPYDGLVFVCERPSAQTLDAQGRVHGATGPAIRCRDGWEVYAWHGVRVPAHVILAPDTITSDQILAERNAQVRQVLVERFGGVARLCRERKATVLDHAWCANTPTTEPARQYHLLTLDLGDGQHRPYLAMRNPSTGEEHIEGVGPEVRTVRQALHWYKPDGLRRIPVAPTGADWYQQGDVCIWPKGARAVKEFPTLLT